LKKKTGPFTPEEKKKKKVILRWGDIEAPAIRETCASTPNYCLAKVSRTRYSRHKFKKKKKSCSLWWRWSVKGVKKKEWWVGNERGCKVEDVSRKRCLGENTRLEKGKQNDHCPR